MQRKYLGGCHCRRIRFEVTADLDAAPITICNCSNCTMRGFLHHHVEKHHFNLVSGYDDLKLYKFGTLTAEHYFCKWCGVESFYRSRSDPDKWDVNVRCLEDATTGERVDLYRLKYQLGDGRHWDEWQAERHRGGTTPPPRLWRLIAPDDAVDPALDIAAEFERRWSSGP